MPDDVLLNSTAASSVHEATPGRFLQRKVAMTRWLSVGLVLAAVLLLMRALPTEKLFGVVQTWIEGLGIWGPLALGAIYILATLLFIPGSVLTLAAGAIFGLVQGTLIVSLSSTTAAALAFLIARYFARAKVRHWIEQSPKLSAVDEAIGEQGWKIVALLRLSPAVPFNLQNYLYGVTAVRFWPCVLASWGAMLPGTFMYVYLGSIGGAAAAGRETSAAEWTLRTIGLLATIVVSVYIARLARNAIHQRTEIGENETSSKNSASGSNSGADSRAEAGLGGKHLMVLAVASLLFLLSVWAFARQDAVKSFIEGLLGGPPAVTSVEAYSALPHGPSFDHSIFDSVLKKHVDQAGLVDYAGLQSDAQELDAYLDQLAAAPFAELGRNEKLALLINAYNAFTLRLILDHYPLQSIQDIPSSQRWEARRWDIAGNLSSLNQIEHESIRPNFKEPRVHFALVCAAIGCPPLRNEAYTADRLEDQLAAQTSYVHGHERWFQFDADKNQLRLTSLYKWYRGDFEQAAGSIVEFASRYSEPLAQYLRDNRMPTVKFLEYDWSLNSQQQP